MDAVSDREGILSDPDADPIAKSRALGRLWVTLPEDRVFRKRTVVAGFVVVVGLLLVPIIRTERNTTSTNEAVTDDVAALQQRVADLEAQRDTLDDRIVDLEGQRTDQDDVIRQLTDAVLMYGDLLRANGVEPPPVTVRPGEDP